MVTTEVSTAVSGMKPSSPPSESDRSTDFLDNDRLKETFSSGSLDFDDWTLLISEVENSFPDDIEKLCLVYDAFLLEFPLCYGYWRKYAYHKIKLCSLEDAVDVFERAIQAATYSVDVWLDYCTFAVAAYEDPHDVCRLFERGISFVGKDYSCCALWDKYVEFLLGQKQWSSLAHVYLRTLRYPTKKLHCYYKNFRKIAASLKEKIKCSLDVNGDLSSDPMEEDLDPTRHTDEEISVVIRDLMGPSSNLDVAKALHAYLSIGEQFYQDSQELKEKISCFETQIRRPYFHVKPLDIDQLDNWHKYLSFAETYGDFDWAIKLYERCLIPCANITEFWFRYVDFVESNGGRELANFALARASQTFVKNESAIHLFNARFKEHVGDASAASVALSRCGEELGVGFVENVTKKANMEKRLGNFEAAYTTYREALKKTLIGKENLETTALLYLQFSRLKYIITNSADEAAQILIEGNEKVPHCKLLLEELIRLMMMHRGSRQVDLLDLIIDKEISHKADSSAGLSAEDKENISNLYMEFIDLCGTIHDVRKALGRHIKLFPHSAKAKLHESRPLGNSLRELIQRREKTRECLNQDQSTNKGFGGTVVSPLEENKGLPLSSDGAPSKDDAQSDYINTEPNVESLASGHQAEGSNTVAESEKLCESHSDLSVGLKADEGGERCREVSIPIQDTAEPGFVSKQAHFSSSSADNVKSDAIEIQPSSFRNPQSHQNQEFHRQTSRNRFQRRDFNPNHRYPKPRSQETPPQMSYPPVTTGSGDFSQQMAIAPRDNLSVSQSLENQCQYSAYPMVQQPSYAYPQAQIPGQHMSVASSGNPAAVQSSFSQIPQNQYQGSAAQVQPSFAYPQSQIPQHPVQSNDQLEGKAQSNEAYNQMWQQYYYYNYYYYYQQQQQQLPSEQPQPNQTSQPPQDPNLVPKQYQSQAGTQHPQSQHVEQLNAQQQSQEPQNQEQIQFQQQEWFQQQQQQQEYHLYLQQQQLQGEAKNDEQRPSMPQISTKESVIQKSGECGGHEVEHSSDTSITSI